MLDGKANGCSQWFLSHGSVASGLEKPLLAGLSGLGMYRGHQGLPRQFYKEQCKEGEEGADKKSVGNNAAREAENKIKWRERVAMYVAPQRSLSTGEHTHALDSLIQQV